MGPYQKLILEPMNESSLFLEDVTLNLIGQMTSRDLPIKVQQVDEARTWLWRSWQSGCFRHQRSVVQIPTSAKYSERTYLSIAIQKIRKKRPGLERLKKVGRSIKMIFNVFGSNQDTFCVLFQDISSLTCTTFDPAHHAICIRRKGRKELL